MVRMGGPHAADPPPIVVAIEPAHELRADAAANKATAFLAQALARDDEDDPQVALRRPFQEPPDGSLRSHQRQAVQI